MLQIFRTRLLQRSKQRLFLYASIALFAVSFNCEAAKIPIFFSWDGEKNAKVFNLPDVAAYMKDGDFLDVGVIWKEVNIFFVPVYCYEARFCFVSRKSLKEDSYYGYNSEAIPDEVRSNIGEASSRIPVWNRWGGKLLLFLILVAIVISSLSNKETAAPEAVA